MSTCQFEGCESKATNRGYCNKHYQQLWKQGLIKRKRRVKRRPPCKVEGCSVKSVHKGLCSKHYKQMIRHGKTFKTRFEPNEFIDYQDLIGIVIRDGKGKLKAEAFVDKEDDWVKNYKWHLVGKRGYVATFNEENKHCYLHRFFYPNSVQVDHKDNNPLNNHKNNLRPCDNAQNSWNTGIMKHNASGVPGVYFSEPRDRWIARIEVYGKKHWLGQFKSFQKAVRVRKRAEKKYFGEFRRTNKKQGVTP